MAASDTYLLQVHGRTPLTTYGTQVALKAASLNTNDCFVLVTPKGNWVSMGKGSTGDEREMAKRIAQITDPDPEIVYEGRLKMTKKVSFQFSTTVHFLNFQAKKKGTFGLS